MYREGRLLNPISIIKFPNEVCNSSSSTNTQGTCYSASECSSKGGTSSGSCASGFGVCCTMSVGCGATITNNNTYFTNNGASSPCSVKVCKCSTDICFLRLDFDDFALSGPITTTYTNTNPNDRGQCTAAQFTATSAGTTPPVLCGTNTGYHMIVNAEEACNTLAFTWSSGSQNWNIQVSQISCDSTYAPDDGCLQWFTGTEGTIYTYNYAGGLHLNNQEYSNCIRPEQGYCSIGYTSCTTTSFSMSGFAAAGVSGDDCTADYILIPEGAVTAGSTTNVDRYCGGLFLATSGTPTTTTVYSTRQPYTLGVVFSASETDQAAAPSENSGGFCIQYKQSAC